MFLGLVMGDHGRKRRPQQSGDGDEIRPPTMESEANIRTPTSAIMLDAL